MNYKTSIIATATIAALLSVSAPAFAGEVKIGPYWRVSAVQASTKVSVVSHSGSAAHSAMYKAFNVKCLDRFGFKYWSIVGKLKTGSLVSRGKRHYSANYKCWGK